MWSAARTLDGIPDRVVTKVDVSCITSDTEMIRHKTMTVTRDMIKKLEPMGFGDKFDAAVRGLMVIGHNVPIKTMCVGLYPYEQDILPPIATSLAYSPLKTSGSTPSVQILSQAMTIVAKRLRMRVSKKMRKSDTGMGIDNSDLLGKFTMLLRCSYLCSVAGISFINCVPIPVNSMAKRVRCASIFSEWLGRMIEIHFMHGFKMSIVAMGEFAKDSVRMTFSSFRGTNTKVNYVSAVNPAMIAYMNIHKYPGADPIQTVPTGAELDMNRLFNIPIDVIPIVEYEWKVYPEGVLDLIMKDQSIISLTRSLVHHTPEELLVPFVTMTNNLFGNMGSIPTGFTPGAIPDTDDVASRTGSTHQQPARTPTGPIFNTGGNNMDPSHTAGHSYGGGGGGGGGGQQNMAPGNFFVGKNSIIAQMNDATGKSKSQQVIVLENMINKLELILESFRSRSVTIEKMVEMMTTIVDRHSVDDNEVEEIVEVFKERFPEELTRLEEAAAVVAAMPALIEGDTGVIESMSQPAAPLMRRYDGTTMRDGIYEQMMVDRASGVAQARNPPEGLNAYSNTNQNVGTSIFADGGPMANINSNNNAGSVAGGNIVSSQVRDASLDLFMSAIEQFATDDMLDAVQRDLFDTTNTASTTNDTNMMEVMTKAIAIYTTANNGRTPSTESIKSMIDLLEPPTDDNMIDIGRMIKEFFTDPEGLTSFFDNDL